MVELVRSGRTPEALAREFEPSAQAIRNWVAQAGRDAGERTDGLHTGKREEMRRLRRENRRLRDRAGDPADHPAEPLAFGTSHPPAFPLFQDQHTGGVIFKATVLGLARDFPSFSGGRPGLQRRRREMVGARHEVWWADLDEPRGSAPGFRRPILIVQADAFNRSRTILGS